jgi:Uma2 family endonuclease
LGVGLIRISEEEYLAIDRAAEFRSELLDGEMVARSAVSIQRGRLQGNVLGELYPALRGRGGEAFGSNLRVRVSPRMYTYPDISVVFGKPRAADAYQDILVNPIVLFEILSPSTEEYDRGIKFRHYRAMDSLKEYILVDQDQIRIEQYARQGNNTWTLRDHQTLEEELKIASIGVSLPLSRIYDRVELPPAA